MVLRHPFSRAAARTRPAATRLILVISAIGGAASPVLADWPQFRGPTGQGQAEQSNPPLQWGPAENVAWRTPLEGLAWSSPILFGDRIFLTTAVELDEQGQVVASVAAEAPVDFKNGPTSKFDVPSPAVSLRAMALDVRTGAKLWDEEVFRYEQGEFQTPHAKNSFASPTPITDGRFVYVHYGPHGTAALDLDGRVAWTNQIEYDARHGGGGSPVIAGDSLVFNCDGVEDPFVVGLDRRSGREIWRTPRQEMDYERFAFSTPLAIPSDRTASGIQLVSPGSHMVGSYDPDTGKELWHVYFEKRWSLVPRPVFVDGLVLVCNGGEAPPELVAIRPNGQGNVTDTHIVWRHDKHVPLTSSVVASNGLVFMVSDGGVAACTEAATGRVLWRKRLGGNYSASPLSAGGRIYFPSEAGDCHVISATRQFEELAVNRLDEPILASFAVDGDALIVRTGDAVYRIEDQRN